jgi:hypothetical protein
MALAFLWVKVAFLLMAYAIRAIVAFAFFAYRRPWAAIASVAIPCVLLALPEYLA